MSVVFLKGKNVTLRPIEKCDIPNLSKWINDPEVRQFVYSYLPTPLLFEEKWVEELGKRNANDIVLLIELHNEGVPIGTMGLHRIDWRSRVATTGALIGETRFQSKGYGTEAKMLLLQYAFYELGLRKICSEVFAFNGRSKRYLEKSGYTVEGVRKKQIFANGDYHDVILLALFKEDFPEVWEKWKHLVL